MAEFDRFADEYTFFVHHERDRKAEAETLRYVPRSSRWAIDLGCGPGLLTRRLATFVENIIALDLSRAFLATVQASRTSNMLLIQADIERLPFISGQFNFVTSTAALHETELQTSLPAIRRLVRPGGRLVIWDVMDNGTNRAAYNGLKGAVENFPRRAKVHGIRVAMRVSRFIASQAWIQHNRRHQHPTAEQFRQIYSNSFPGCRFIERELMMGAFWESPA